MKAVKIGKREIGYNLPPFVIAEIGINHNGSVEVAEKLIDAAVEAGCDIIVVQSTVTGIIHKSAHGNTHREIVRDCGGKISEEYVQGVLYRRRIERG